MVGGPGIRNSRKSPQPALHQRDTGGSVVPKARGHGHWWELEPPPKGRVRGRNTLASLQDPAVQGPGVSHWLNPEGSQCPRSLGQAAPRDISLRFGAELEKAQNGLRSKTDAALKRDHPPVDACGGCEHE